MKHLALKDDDEFSEYNSDLASMQELLHQAGYSIDKAELKVAWEKYSDSMAAGWMMPPESGDEIYWAISSYVEVRDASLD